VAEKPYWADALLTLMGKKSANQVATDSYDDDGSVSQAYVSGLLTGKYRLYRTERPKLRALARGLGVSVNRLIELTGIQRDGVAPDVDDSENTVASRLTPVQQQAREQAVQDFLAEVRPGTHTSVFDSGAGPSWMDEDPSTWIIEDPELFRRYPNLGTHRIVGSSIEPFASDGDVAYVVPDRELIASGRLVLVWLSDNGRMVKFLAHEDADGEHLLIQSNPDTEFRTPPGSALLGVVVGIRKMGVPKLPIKRIIEAITERMPYLLEEDS
jgi:hypothetical protein